LENVGASDRAQVVVVGAGIVGLATVHALARRGVRAICIERSAPGEGQSGGMVRVFRHRHADERLTRLALAANRGWAVWEDELGLPLLDRCGVLMLGPGAADEAERLRGQGAAAELVRPDEQRELLSLCGELTEAAALDVHGGSIRARDAVETLAAGADIRRAEALALRATARGVDVATSTGLLRAQHVVLAAGAGTAALARLVGVDPPLETSLAVRGTYRRSGPARPAPCLLDRRQRPGAYGSPWPDGRAYALGLSSAIAELETGDGTPPAVHDVVSATNAYVAAHIGDLDPVATGVRVCAVTTLPWGEDAFAIWSQERVSVLAGHNLFKFGPVLGEALARAATDGPDPAFAPEARLGADARALASRVA
jgi:sarcosine oxidase